MSAGWGGPGGRGPVEGKPLGGGGPRAIEPGGGSGPKAPGGGSGLLYMGPPGS